MGAEESPEALKAGSGVPFAESLSRGGAPEADSSVADYEGWAAPEAPAVPEGLEIAQAEGLELSEPPPPAPAPTAAGPANPWEAFVAGLTLECPKTQPEPDACSERLADFRRFGEVVLGAGVAGLVAAFPLNFVLLQPPADWAPLYYASAAAGLAAGPFVGYWLTRGQSKAWRAAAEKAVGELLKRLGLRR